MRKLWPCVKLRGVTDDELLKSCTTRQAREGASSMKCDVPVPGVGWGHDGSPGIVRFHVVVVPHPRIHSLPCSQQARGVSLLPSAPLPWHLLLRRLFLSKKKKRFHFYLFIYFQKCELATCAAKERLKVRRQNQTAPWCGALGSWIRCISHTAELPTQSRGRAQFPGDFSSVTQPHLPARAGQ